MIDVDVDVDDDDDGNDDGDDDKNHWDTFDISIRLNCDNSWW